MYDIVIIRMYLILIQTAIGVYDDYIRWHIFYGSEGTVMKIAETNIIAAFLLQLKNEHRTPFVNVGTLVDFSKYLDRIAKRRGFEYEFTTGKKALIAAVQATPRYFHIMKVHNETVGTETFIQLNYDANLDKLYESCMGSCEFDIRRILSKGALDYIDQIAKIEKSTAGIEMGMCS